MSTLPPNACRLRVRYAKDGRLAYLGHLEVMQTVMRSVRRSGVPFEVGNGFARRMRIQFSQALPVGASSRAEYYDLPLSDPLDEAEVLEALRSATPKALAPDAAMLLPRRMPALEAWADFSCWKVSVRGLSMDAEDFMARVQELRDKDMLHFMRGTKERSISLKQTLVSCDASDAAGGVDLMLQTRHSPQGSLRPAILVSAACGVAPLRVCRTGQWHLADDGSLIDPMTRA